MLRQREPKDYSLTRYYSNMGEAFDDVLDTGPSGGTIEKSKTTPSAPATAIGFDDDASSDLKLILDSQI